MGLIRRILSQENWEIVEAASALQGLEILRQHGDFDVILVDLHMPQKTGLEFLEEAKQISSDLPVIVMTARGSIETAVRAMQLGAFDFLTKPFESFEVVIAVCQRAIAQSQLMRQNRQLKQQLQETLLGGLVGSSAAMKRLRQMIVAVAPTDATVLVIGETGTGKELVSRALHDASLRAQGPFLPVNCGALSENLLESELFGHVRGAFTGATTARRGLFEAASGGTLFLDEVGELSLAMQTRLLRVLQEGEIRPVGSEVHRAVDVRVVAATHRDLEKAVAEGSFREDLYYRLNVFRLYVPPLRERANDIPALTTHFLEKLARRLGKPVPDIEPEAIRWLCQRTWRGNLRQLENTMERALILSSGTVTLQLVQTVSDLVGEKVNTVPEPESTRLPLREARLHFERQYLQHLLELAEGCRAEVARQAHLDPSNLRRLLKRHRLD